MEGVDMAIMKSALATDEKYTKSVSSVKNRNVQQQQSSAASDQAAKSTVSFNASGTSSSASASSSSFRNTASSFQSFGANDQPAPEEKVCHIATTYRVMYFILGTIPCWTIVVSLVLGGGSFSPDRSPHAMFFPWSGALFWAFSSTCLLVSAMSNPLEVKKEARFIQICGFLMGLSPLCAGALLAVEHHRFGDSRANAVYAVLWMLFGITVCLIGPPGFHHLVVMYSELDNDVLHSFVAHGLFKRAPQALGSMLYVSSTGLKTILNTSPDDTQSLVARIGNPICPGFLISCYLFVVWFGTVLVPPVQHQAMSDNLSWTNVMTLAIPRTKAFQGFCFAFLSFLTLLLFAFMEEDGEPLSLYLEIFCYFAFVFFAISFVLLIYDIALGHMLNEKRVTKKELLKNASSAFDPEELSVQKMMI
ncbi:hypothetical protein TeGR_g5958 [Tetraparma gracilis]|uniref:Uncharacterized protein n=1 Tax=Tetraparma gracilis TaxID=2962635 RepID=A0ABQ6N1R3_9STRA|nr:hypothetical protein TeGR_g5958 [Tetraparma gracilis]